MGVLGRPDMFCPQYGQLLNLGGSCAGAACVCTGCAGACWGCPCCICIWGDGLPQLLQNLYGNGFGLPQYGHMVVGCCP